MKTIHDCNCEGQKKSRVPRDARLELRKARNSPYEGKKLHLQSLGVDTIGCSESHTDTHDPKHTSRVTEH